MEELVNLNNFRKKELEEALIKIQKEQIDTDSLIKHLKSFAKDSEPIHPKYKLGKILSLTKRGKKIFCEVLLD